MKPARVVHVHDLNLIREAIERVKMSRECLKLAGARQAARALARALKSMEGAERHAVGVLLRLDHQRRQETPAACMACGKDVEPDRRIWQYPTCHACLPPPPPLPIAPVRES